MTLVQTKPKRRTESKEVRRRQLIDATIASIAELGMSDTTLSSVAKRAGVGHGTVNLHFPSKANLLEETLRFLAEEHYRLWSGDMKSSTGSAKNQLEALINVDFNSEVCSQQKLAVWFTFWGHAKFRPFYLDVCNLFDEERSDVIAVLCRKLNQEGGYAIADTDAVARRLESLIDGLWLSMLLYPERYSRETAHTDAFDHLAEVFPKHFCHSNQSINKEKSGA